MSAQISKDCTRPLVMSKDETKEKIAKLVGLNKSTVQDIKARINDYGSPLRHKEDPFASFKEINMELANLDAFVSIETLQLYVDRLDFKSYRAAHKPRLTTRHCKFKWGGDGAMVWGCFWGGSFRPLEIIDTSSVDQETYINILANKVPFLVYKCNGASGEEFYLPRGWSFLPYW
ncbi:hypothetical protein G6F29_011797 [Rhizopus arrhizus]|uniref:Uncharacterized protein n=1 Tax=Rhizopus oryzae TaxID=64495 RepID=A0A9P7BM36_RHIOR|nr:hypothetical protein G6F24_012962 [Rhizopus arrhizus]KAG0775267.1 hypothetical protein G6F22_013428 [Rhizopus arrhizus]KAG0779463.1 hypothetical protein G6F21_012572 [Rhizopus arrhizus]KAG0805642.1 hypothetical protein G6F20_011744 [Rhizopus arrhizus]KAG0821699.1 hypothetical protein G6F19_011792 [Rhizopus arrhizus]